MPELWDCYDREFNKVEGKVLIRGNHKELGPDEYHLVCEIAVRHADGTYLLMQRDPHKPIHPGEWELSAGGSALQGENPETCAKRELFEETGLIADSLQEVGRITSDRNHSHYVIYLAYVSCDKNTVTLQEGETVAFQWVEKSTVLDMKDQLASHRIFELLPELELISDERSVGLSSNL